MHDDSIELTMPNLTSGEKKLLSYIVERLEEIAKEEGQFTHIDDTIPIIVGIVCEARRYLSRKQRVALILRLEQALLYSVVAELPPRGTA
jgi:hypothetical protein